MPRHFAAKAVVAQKDVANAGNQYARLGHNNSVSSFEFRVWYLGSSKLKLELEKLKTIPSVQPPQAKRKSDGPVDATFPDRAQDHRQALPPGGPALHSPVRLLQPLPFSPRVPDQKCHHPRVALSALDRPASLERRRPSSDQAASY